MTGRNDAGARAPTPSTTPGRARGSTEEGRGSRDVQPGREESAVAAVLAVLALPVVALGVLGRSLGTEIVGRLR